MRLLWGPPGSGKTTGILRQARKLIHNGDGGFRIVVPTATMAEHLRNSLAREGLVVRPSTVGTLSSLIAELTPGAEECGGDELALAVEQQMAGAAGGGVFAGLLETSGLARTIASAIEDLSNSGCDPLQWAALGRMGVWRGPVLRAFGAVWESVEDALKARGLCLRASRIALAAAAVRGGAAGPLPHTIFADGFFLFSRVEIELLKELDRACALWLTLPDWAGARPARELLEQQPCRLTVYQACRTRPEPCLIKAADPQRECEEIALRVVDARRAGFDWRDIGVILRAEQPYAPLLERTFARAGIPARFYFGRSLAGTPICRYLNDLVRAAASGWEHRATLAALRSEAHEAGRTAAAAALERSVVDALPGQGLEAMSRIVEGLDQPGASLLQDLIGSWLPMALWDQESVPPSQWAARIAALAAIATPPAASSPVDPHDLARARSDAASLRAIQDTLASVERLLPPGAVSLDTFWRLVSPILAAAAVRPPDGRRDAVHVMDVHESRQWELPVVFVCGLMEGDFPRRPSIDPLLGDELRFQLQKQGFPVLKAADREAEEQFLLEVARTRATRILTFSYAAHQADGAPALRSFFLDALDLAEQPARALAIRPSSPVPAAPRRSLQEKRVLDAILKRHSTFAPTAVEEYLQCPFRFFARSTLGLREAPAPPEKRLTPAALGGLMHRVIERWHRDGGDLPSLLFSNWQALLARLRIPPAWRNETLWLLLERSAKHYAAKAAPMPGWKVDPELELSLEIDGFRFAGVADRVDRDAEGRVRVLELKFVGSTGLKKREGKVEEGISIQAPLYAKALAELGYVPEAYSIVAIRGDTLFSAFEDPEQVRAGMDLASRRASAAAFAITQGDIRVMPADEDLCSHCSYRDACRKRDERAAPELAAEMSENG